MTTEQDVLGRIRQLVEEERELRDRRLHDQIGDSEERSRLQAVEVELDQCWDLLRQRRALREFGKDENEAKARPATEVEGYLG